MKRIVAIDLGVKRSGIAVSDPFQMFASPKALVEHNENIDETLKKILGALDAKIEVEEFIVGLPLHLSGKESDMSLRARLFTEKLKKATGKPVHLIDERLTSKAAENLLREGNMKRKERTKIVDTVSAALILQTYLDRRVSSIPT
jgi:putative Holliday junction resolvase